MSQTKILDFCGSGELLSTMLADVHFCEALSNEIAGRKVTVIIFAEDEKTTLQGNDLSMQVEDDLRFGESMESLDGRHEPEYQPRFGPSADGWITWNGGECPVSLNTRVKVKFRRGISASPAGSCCAGAFRWSHKNSDRDIVAYKIVDQFSAERGDDEETQV